MRKIIILLFIATFSLVYANVTEATKDFTNVEVYNAHEFDLAMSKDKKYMAKDSIIQVICLSQPLSETNNTYTLPRYESI